jgi:general secretion pathway protein K
VLGRLVAALKLPPETTLRIVTAVTRHGPLRSLADIPEVDATSRATLAPYVSFLPAGGAVNLNTADAVVLGAVLQNQTAASRLVAMRAKNGFITPQDLRDLGLISTGGAGFTSAVFDVTVTAQVDDVTVVLTSRIQRVQGVGTQEVRVIARQFGPDPESEVPPLPAGF